MPSMFQHNYDTIYTLEEFDAHYSTWSREKQRLFWQHSIITCDDAEESQGKFSSFGIELFVSAEYTLMVGFSRDLTFNHLVFRCHVVPEWIDLGWRDGGCHPYPHALRLEEVQAICHHIDATSPHLHNPDLPLLLLYEFTITTWDENYERLCHKIHEAWYRTNLFTFAEIVEQVSCDNQSIIDYLHRLELNVEDFRVVWKFSSKYGWVLCGGEKDYGVFSVRVEENDQFPFAKFAEMMRQIQEYSNDVAK